jgi:hypothetical protein
MRCTKGREKKLKKMILMPKILKERIRRLSMMISEIKEMAKTKLKLRREIQEQRR